MKVKKKIVIDFKTLVSVLFRIVLLKHSYKSSIHQKWNYQTPHLIGNFNFSLNICVSLEKIWIRISLVHTCVIFGTFLLAWPERFRASHNLSWGFLTVSIFFCPFEEGTTQSFELWLGDAWWKKCCLLILTFHEKFYCNSEM